MGNLTIAMINYQRVWWINNQLFLIMFVLGHPCHVRSGDLRTLYHRIVLAITMLDDARLVWFRYQCESKHAASATYPGNRM